MIIDWLNRPKGATHYDPASMDSVCWYRPNHQRGWDYWSESAAGSNWIHCGCVSNQFRFIEVPAELAWSEGEVPPSGIDVEVLHPGHDEWVRRHIKYIGGAKGIVVFRGEVDDEFACPVISCKFRPARTPEQAKAEERKAAIEKMTADALIYYGAGELMSAREYVECAIAALHDAGYRKQVTA